jgi:hypothetical protein
MEGVIFRTKGNSSNGINMCEMHNVLTIFIYVFLQTSLGQWFFFQNSENIGELRFIALEREKGPIQLPSLIRG